MNSDVARFTTHIKPVLQHTDQVVNRFEREWSNAQHRYAIRFAAILQDKLHVFVACFTELRSTYMFLDEKTLVKISLNAGLNQNNLSRNRGQEDYFDSC